PAAVGEQRDLLTGLAEDYKRINAPVGELGLSTLAAATFAFRSPDTAQLAQTNAALDDVAVRRDDLVERMRTVLEAAAFQGQPADPTQVASLQSEAQNLREAAAALPHV